MKKPVVKDILVRAIPFGKSFQSLKKADESPKDNYFDPDLLSRKFINIGRGMVNKGGSHPISTRLLDYHLSHGSYSLMTAHNPMGSAQSPEQNSEANIQLENDLKQQGAVYHKVKGKYGGNEEESFMVHHTANTHPKQLEAIAKKHGQESIFHSVRGENKLAYVNGPSEGLHRKGQGYARNVNAKDDFSQIKNAPKSKFSLNVDWDKMHKSESEHTRTYEIESEEGHKHSISFHVDHNKFHQDA